MICTAIGVLLSVSISIIFFYLGFCNASLSQNANAGSAARVALPELLERIECIFRQLEIYMKFQMTAGMMDVIVKVLVEVLRIVAIATKEINETRAGELISGDELTLSLPVIRIISGETCGEEGYPGCATEAQQGDDGGSNGSCRSPEYLCR
jgi:hypothetical protein